MRITFITPPALDGELPAERTAGCTRLVYNMPNIYELIVVAVLEQLHDVRHKDFVLEGGSLRAMETFIKSDDSDCYMLWCVNLSLVTDLAAIRIIRRFHPQKWIVAMGPGVTYYTDKLLVDKYVIVVRGEPEVTVNELVAKLDRKEDFSDTQGLAYLREGKVWNNPSRELLKDLDTLPFPARRHIERFTFTNPKLKKHPYTTVLTGRNCPFKCIYCVPSSLTFAREIEYKRAFNKKPPVYSRSVENVVAELDMLATKGYRAIAFIDDNFITTAARLQGICEGIKKHGFSWGCQARVDAITEETARILADAKCEFVDIGVESFDDQILRYVKKGVTQQEIYQSINLLKKYGVPVKLNILIGTSPLETKETVRDTLRRAKALKVSQVMFNIVAPFPGTEFYDIAREKGWIAGGEYTPVDVQRHSIINYPNLSSREMEKMLFSNNILFYLRPSFILQNIGGFGSFADFAIALKALKRKLFH